MLRLKHGVLFALLGFSLLPPVEMYQTDNLHNEVMSTILELEYIVDKDDWEKFLVPIYKQLDDIKTPTFLETVIHEGLTDKLIDAEETNILQHWEQFKPDSIRERPSGTNYKVRALLVVEGSDGKHPVSQSLNIIQELIDPEFKKHPNIFQDDKITSNYACEHRQSHAQLLFNLYTSLQITQLKAFVMVQFSKRLLHITGGSITSKGEYELFTNIFNERSKQQGSAIKIVMRDASNELWACDTGKHKEGETFEKITRFLQGYIVNEVDLNSDQSCSQNCAAYKYTKQHGCFKNQFCSRQEPCRGSVVGCRFVDSDMWICQSPHMNGRRYDWIEFENGEKLGRQDNSCKRVVDKVDSWWRYLFWHCSYCFCYCDDHTDARSHRYFSLVPVTANTAKNMVITGLRFRKMNKVFYIQIQQGELLPEGGINSTTVAWVPINKMNIDDSSVEEGKDYYKLTWQQRFIDLDDILLDSNQVLTGVRFRRLGEHLNLEVQGTEMHYMTGKLMHNGTKSQWYANDNTDAAEHHPRKHQDLGKAGVPDQDYGPNKIDSKPDTFISFEASDAELDAGQSAIPFIDVQEITPTPPVPLVGMGIYHKGRKLSGGFIGLKVFTQTPEENMFSSLNEYVVLSSNDENEPKVSYDNSYPY